MSEREAGSRKLAAGSVDAAIDGAVRSMLDVEPPPGLRGRVMDRIAADDPVASAFPTSSVVSAFRRKGAWIFAPVAAAALIVLAVLAPWRDAVPPAGTTPAPPAIARNAPPASPPVIAPPVVTPRTPQPLEPAGARGIAANDARRPRGTAAQSDRLIDAAAATAVEDMNFTAISALAGPEAIAVERLADPLPSVMRSIEPAPLQIPALEITALPEAPRERREE